MLELEFLFNEINLLGILRQFHAETYKITKHHRGIYINKLKQIIESDVACQHGKYLLTSRFNCINFRILKNNEFWMIREISIRNYAKVKDIKSYKNLILILITGILNIHLKVYSLVKKSQDELDYRCIQTITIKDDNERKKAFWLNPTITKYQNLFIINSSKYIKFYKFDTESRQFIETNSITAESNRHNFTINFVIYHNMLVYIIMEEWHSLMYCYNLDTKTITQEIDISKKLCVKLSVQDDKLVMKYDISYESNKRLYYTLENDQLEPYKNLNPVQDDNVICEFIES
jgi:hypothetical protein